MEFAPSATVETVIELDENGQPIIQSTVEELASEELISEETSAVEEEITPESEDKSDEQK